MKKAKEILYKIKYFCQKIFRKNHISDIEIWNCKEHLAKYILPRLKVLRSQDFFYYPPNDVNSISISRTVIDKNNDEDKKNLSIWLEMLDEMIYAFEYVLYGDTLDKKGTKFYIKYFGRDPYETFNNDLNVDSINYEIVTQAHEKALKGFEYFGKYFIYLYN